MKPGGERLEDGWKDLKTPSRPWEGGRGDDRHAGSPAFKGETQGYDQSLNERTGAFDRNGGMD